MVATFACVAVVACAAVASASTSSSVHTFSTPSTLPLRTGVMDPILFLGSQQAQAFTTTRATGATYVRLAAVWAQLAPATPSPAFHASDPTSIGYNWRPLDQEVRNAEHAGLAPIVDVGHPPRWALTAPVSGVDGGTPSTDDLGAFATALAQHYDGSHGAPAVHVFQVWNEPNLSRDLSPVDPSAYRGMVNAFAAAVHQVDPQNLVVAGALDPFANSTSHWHTVAPLTFMRQLLCVSGGRRPHATCKTPVHFDVWSHHPYTFGGPFGKAKGKNDVSLGDLPKMTALLQTAEKLHRISSTHKVQFWVTEFAMDTNPPRVHNALSLYLQSRATAESLHQMWLSGVSLVTWFLLQDEPLNTPYQSGLYYLDNPIATAQPKPTLTAFSFPFVAYLGTGGDAGTVSVWGRDATSSPALVTVQLGRSVTGHWKTVARIRANRYGIFKASLPLTATKRNWLRATVGSAPSLAFSLKRPVYPHYGPWGN